MKLKKLFILLFIGLPHLQVYGSPEKYNLKVGTFEKEYDIKAPTQGSKVKIAYIYDYADNLNLMQESANVLYTKLQAQNLLDKIDVVVVPGDKANGMGAILATKIHEKNPKVSLVILRGSNKAGEYKKVKYQSITSAAPKEMYMREDQFMTLQGKNVIIFDDVISTGATIKAATSLVHEAKGNILAYVCVGTEGEMDVSNGGKNVELFEGQPIIKVTHMPVIPIS